LDIDEFKKASKKAEDATDNSKKPLWGIFSLADKNKDNQLSKQEWSDGYLQFDAKASVDLVSEIYDEADKDNNG